MTGTFLGEASVLNREYWIRRKRFREPRYSCCSSTPKAVAEAPGTLAAWATLLKQAARNVRSYGLGRLLFHHAWLISFELTALALCANVGWWPPDYFSFVCFACFESAVCSLVQRSVKTFISTRNRPKLGETQLIPYELVFLLWGFWNV